MLLYNLQTQITYPPEEFGEIRVDLPDVGVPVTKILVILKPAGDNTPGISDIVIKTCLEPPGMFTLMNEYM